MHSMATGLFIVSMVDRESSHLAHTSLKIIDFTINPWYPLLLTILRFLLTNTNIFLLEWIFRICTLVTNNFLNKRMFGKLFWKELNVLFTFKFLRSTVYLFHFSFNFEINVFFYYFIFCTLYYLSALVLGKLLKQNSSHSIKFPFLKEPYHIYIGTNFNVWTTLWR